MRTRRLEAHAARAGARGVKVTCKVQWDYPPHEAIVRRATRNGADLIIAECHEGSRLKPWLMHLTDWELLRTSQVPVLLLKNTRLYQRPPILAAFCHWNWNPPACASDSGTRRNAPSV